jgi:hypothetical protein
MRTTPVSTHSAAVMTNLSLRTREFDTYDKVMPDAEIPRIGIAARVGDDFRGTARVKIETSAGPNE